MSRADYNEDIDNWALIKCRGRVASATRGKRGQAMLKAMLAALDAMPLKELIEGALQEPCGQVCAFGALAQTRGINVSQIDPENARLVAQTFDIAEPLAREVVYENDEGAWSPHNETPAQRWVRMRAWVERQIIKEPA